MRRTSEINRLNLSGFLSASLDVSCFSLSEIDGFCHGGFADVASQSGLASRIAGVNFG